LGVALLPLFTRFDSIYQALSGFTSTVAPPLVVATVLGAVWPRFNSRSAFWSVVIGFTALVLSQFFPQLIRPVSHGIPADNGYAYIRSLFGLLATLLPATTITLLSRSEASSRNDGLVMQSLDHARHRFKDGAPNDEKIGQSRVLPFSLFTGDEPTIRLPRDVMQQLAIRPGDLLHVGDDRWWLGGFRSLALACGEPIDGGESALLSSAAIERGHLHSDRPIRIEKTL
jgi:hypothetical protein